MPNMFKGFGASVPLPSGMFEVFCGQLKLGLENAASRVGAGLFAVLEVFGCWEGRVARPALFCEEPAGKPVI
jgi:hypothetical protein